MLKSSVCVGFYSMVVKEGIFSALPFKSVLDGVSVCPRGCLTLTSRCAVLLVRARLHSLALLTFGNR